MESVHETDGSITLRMSEDDAVVMHLRIALSEFEADLEEIELPEPVDRKVFSDVQQALAQLIPELGNGGAYQARIDRAYAAIDPKPY